MGLRCLRMLTFAGLACLILGAVPAKASLIGQTITCSTPDAFDDWFCDSPTAVVGAGVEFVIFREASGTGADTAFFSIDVGDKSVKWAMDQSVSIFSIGTSVDITTILGDLFWSTDSTATIIGIENFVASNVTDNEIPKVPLSADRITVFDNSLSISWSNSSWQVAGAFISFDLVTTHGVEVPEPATLAIFGFGLAGLGFMTRRRRRKELAA